jgi:hypothetical protein
MVLLLVRRKLLGHGPTIQTRMSTPPSRLGWSSEDMAFGAIPVFHSHCVPNRLENKLCSLDKVKRSTYSLT